MQLLILSHSPASAKSLLPALAFLDHAVITGSLRADPHTERSSASSGGRPASTIDIVVIDATSDLAAASSACRHIAASDDGVPVLVVVSTAGLAALKNSWGFDDWLLPEAQPAEVETRLRLLADRASAGSSTRAASIGELHIDEDTYIVRLRGRPLDLTFREFELLKYLATNPGRVFTRSQLLQQVWGYDYFGGTRTVDVHIRRLRAKLGPEYEQLIGTVRGVGYKLDPHGASGEAAADG